MAVIKRGFISFSLAVAIFASYDAANAAVVVRKPGPAVNQLADPIVAESAKGDAARVVDLSGDAIADGARLAREAEKEKIVFAVGPDATAIAGDVNLTAAVIAVGVPNPARMKTNAAYLSVYPSFDRIFAFTAKMNARTIGFLFSPSQNREVAADFSAAAAAKGLTVVPIAVSSSGELVRVLKEAVPKVDALLLAVDPILFDRMSLRFVVETASAARRPTIGFIPELTSFGVTASLSVEPSALAAAAIKEAATARRGTRSVKQVDNAWITVSRKSAELVGIKVENLGANKIQ